jgi:tripartite-type tricarboxylate transporter receptor subunit TctC
MLTRRSILFAPALVSLASGAASAQTYPTGPVTFLVTFPAGGSIDVVMRAIAPKLQERLGKPVVIENRAGAGGVIATAAVAKAPPDGQTLLASASSLASNPALFKTLPFDTLKDLQSVTLLFRTPLALVVTPELPVKSVADLVALLKQKPGAINYAHGGPGSAIHLAAELFKTMTGTAMNGVAYRGAPLALNDVMANHVALMFADAGSVMGLINSGKVRALGVSSLTRVPALPNVPTIAESGVPGFDAVGWTMVSAPSGTPSATIDRLNTEITAAAATPEVREIMVKLGTIPSSAASPAEAQKFLAAEINRWSGLIEKAGVAKTLGEP